MFTNFRKVLNIFSMSLIVIGAVCWGILGFFNIEILNVLLGERISKIVYCTIGIFGLYGIHIYMEYSKRLLADSPEKTLEHHIDPEGTYEDQ